MGVSWSMFRLKTLNHKQGSIMNLMLVMQWIFSFYFWDMTKICRQLKFPILGASKKVIFILFLHNGYETSPITQYRRNFLIQLQIRKLGRREKQKKISLIHLFPWIKFWNFIESKSLNSLHVPVRPFFLKIYIHFIIKENIQEFLYLKFQNVLFLTIIGTKSHLGNG